MAGGTWTTQNKVRPGAYINFKSVGDASVDLAERGIVTVPLVLPWGPEKQIIEISASDNLVDVLGIDITDTSALLIKEAFKRAKTLLLYRLNEGAKSTISLGGLTVIAKYSGIKGNSITIIIQSNIDVAGSFDVITMVGVTKVDNQTVATIEELESNAYVVFAGIGQLQVTAGLILAGGTNGAVTNAEYSTYFSKVELYDFNTMGIPSTDPTIKSVATSFIKRLREQEGRKVQVVLEKYPIADYEGVISVKNGVILSDGTTITSDKAVSFVAGATAGANVNESNTYSSYDDAVDVDTRYTGTEIETALKNGELLFTINNGKIVIEQDINTLKTFTNEKQNYFRKNRVIRSLDGINNNVKSLWDTRYAGDEDNNPDGRNLFKKDIIKLLEMMQGIGALENVTADDITIIAGSDKDAVGAQIYAQPVDSMEKLYMTVGVR